MSPLTFPILLALLGAILWFIHLRRHMVTSPPHRRPKLPPGPRSLPIIGNLHMLGTLPHRTLYNLSKKYGPIMSLHLGNVPTIVVTSAAAAELFLKTHDSVFASRPKTQASDVLFLVKYEQVRTSWRSAAVFNSVGGLQRRSPREVAYKKILKALMNYKEDGFPVVGLYGFGGVGKTRMMEEASK